MDKFIEICETKLWNHIRFFLRNQLRSSTCGKPDFIEFDFIQKKMPFSSVSQVFLHYSAQLFNFWNLKTQTFLVDFFLLLLRIKLLEKDEAWKKETEELYKVESLLRHDYLNEFTEGKLKEIVAQLLMQQQTFYLSRTTSRTWMWLCYHISTVTTVSNSSQWIRVITKWTIR